MANKYKTLEELFRAIADTIRAKKNTTGQIVADDFPSEIESISSGIDTSTDTVTPDVLLNGYTAHNADGEQIVGLIPTYDGQCSGGETDKIVEVDEHE